jgi:hypothetical protein
MLVDLNGFEKRHRNNEKGAIPRHAKRFILAISLLGFSAERRFNTIGSSAKLEETKAKNKGKTKKAFITRLLKKSLTPLRN